MPDNPVIDFVKAGKDLLSEEGKKLIHDTSDLIIKDAVIQEKLVANALLIAMNKVSDPYFRRKVFKALS